MFTNKILGTSGLTIGQAEGTRKKVHNKDLCNMFSSCDDLVISVQSKEHGSKKIGHNKKLETVCIHKILIRKCEAKVAWYFQLQM